MKIENYVLKAKRLTMGLEVNVFAAMVHMSELDYKRLEDNKKEPRLNEMIEISKITSKSLEELFNWNSSV